MNKRSYFFLSLFLLLPLYLSPADLTKQAIINGGQQVLYMLGIASTRPKPLGWSSHMMGDLSPEQKQYIMDKAVTQLSTSQPTEQPKISADYNPVSKQEIYARYEQKHGASPEPNNVSVETDAGSVINVVHDLGNVLFGISKSEKRQIARDEAARRAEMSKPTPGIVIGGDPAQFDRSRDQDPYGRSAKEIATGGAFPLPNVKMEPFQWPEKTKTIQEQIVTLQATTQVLTTQVAGTAIGSENMTPATSNVIATSSSPNNIVVKSMSHVPAIGLDDIIKTLECTEPRSEPLGPVVTKQLPIQPMSKPAQISRPLNPVHQLTLPPLQQAYKGAEFFVKNIDPVGAMQTAQAAQSAEILFRDDGIIDAVAGKEAKYALASCALAVGGPLAIGTMCPPCAPFMLPALKMGGAYCANVALPVATGFAIGDGLSAAAGLETSGSKARQKMFGTKKTEILLEEIQRPGYMEPIKLPKNTGFPGNPIEFEPFPGYTALPIKKPEPCINIPVNEKIEDFILTKENKIDKQDKEERKQKIAERERWTNKVARDKAKKLNMGFEEKRDTPQPIKDIGFYNGENWITPDIDGHKGGVWKMFDKSGKRRLGTFSEDLKIKIGD